MELEDEADMSVAELCEGFLAESEDILPVDEDLSVGGAVECAEDLQERGLAGAALADDGEYLALLHAEVHAFQHFQRAEGLVQVAGFNEWSCRKHG